MLGPDPQGTCRDLLRTIYRRRSVRDYTAQVLEKETIETLIDAAIQAPTARRQEPWSFVVVQDKNVLNRLSESVKERLRLEAEAENDLGRFCRPEFNIFYTASTLVLICGKTQSPSVEADCWLAAENLILAACSMGLGSCVIGLAVDAFNTPQWKAEFNIPADTTAFAPIILGVPTAATPEVPRKAPLILAWR